MKAPPEGSPLWGNGAAMLAWMLLHDIYGDCGGERPDLHDIRWIAMDQGNTEWYGYVDKPTTNTPNAVSGNWGIPEEDNTLTPDDFVWVALGGFECHLHWTETRMEVKRDSASER